MFGWIDHNYKIVVCSKCKKPKIITIEIDHSVVLGPACGPVGGNQNCPKCGSLAKKTKPC